MNAYIRRIFFTLINYLACAVYAAPQDNWYKSASWGGVSGAENMIVSDDGLIWIAGNNKIAVYEQNGTLIKQFTNGLTGCTDVALDSYGNVYAAVTNQLIKMDSNGSQVWVKSYSGINILAISDLNHLYISHSSGSIKNGFQILNLDGNITKTVTNITLNETLFDWGNTSIRIARDNSFLIQNNRYGVIHFDSNGSKIRKLSGGGQNKKLSISNDNLYLVARGGLYDPLSNTQVSSMSGISQPYDKCAAFTPNGDLVIARGDNTIDI